MVREKPNETILQKLLEIEAESIKTLMNKERGESEDEAILRHPTETIEVNGVQRLRNRTNAELIGFKTGEVPNDLVEPKERLQYLKTAFEDLDTYCDGVVQNYKTLKTFIEDGYNQYFDKNGNLRQ